MSEEMDVESMEGVVIKQDISDDDMSEENEDDDESQGKTEPKVYLPGQTLKKGEELVADKSAYRLLHRAQSGAPCLSFDILNDDLGNSRENYPLTMYLVAGTQAAQAHVNNILIMKMSNLYGTKYSEDSGNESSDSEEESEEHNPVMSVAPIRHQGCVNRIRCTKVNEVPLAASWSELGRVNVWDLREQLNAIESPNLLAAYRKKCDKEKGGGVKPLFTFKGHLSEGFAVDWCLTKPGDLATGDCKGNIHIWQMGTDSPTWQIDQRPFNSHAPYSVEDLQWSPCERNVLASCSVDKTIKIWDTRVSPHKACMLTASGAHQADINVISWSRIESRFIISGGDDGLLCIWDLRLFGSSNETTPIATFKHHTAPVTTVEWHPTESTVFASGGADNQIAQWDLSVEADSIEADQNEEIAKLPPQLLFIHQGQADIKELHWHPQCPGTMISTAHSGFNVFRTISI